MNGVHGGQTPDPDVRTLKPIVRDDWRDIRGWEWDLGSGESSEKLSISLDNLGKLRASYKPREMVDQGSKLRVGHPAALGSSAAVGQYFTSVSVSSLLG